LFAVSGHKFHAPKGVGALYIRRGIEIPPFIIGGGQERGRRSGTEAVPNIVALGRACQLAHQFTEHQQIRALRDRLEDEILSRFSIASLNGTSDRSQRLPNTSNISFAGLEGPDILAMLDDAGVCVSTGSACNSDSQEVSAVLRAMKIPVEVARGSIRFSLGRYNTAEEIDHTLIELVRVVNQLSEKRSPERTAST
jgi:cysteine desulfurase